MPPEAKCNGILYKENYGIKNGTGQRDVKGATNDCSIFTDNFTQRSQINLQWMLVKKCWYG